MTEQEKKRKAAELAAKIKAALEKRSQIKQEGEFRKQLEEDDPKAFTAMSTFNVLSNRRGLSPEEIKGKFTPAQRKDFVRSIDARQAFGRTLID